MSEASGSVLRVAVVDDEALARGRAARISRRCAWRGNRSASAPMASTR